MFKKTIAWLRNERGSLDQMAWVIGSAVVVGFIIYVLGPGGLAGNTASGIFTQAVSWITSKIGM